MKLIKRVLATILLLGGFFMVPIISSAESSSKPAAAKFYPLIGKWHGQGEMAEPGKAPAKMALTLNCRKVAAGWAVACNMNAKNKNMSISESDLMGVDPVTGKAHWYAVTNLGETHDHLAEWTDANTMHAEYKWDQDGKKMLEDITFIFNKRSLSFRSVVTADGQSVGEFSGKVKH